MSENNTCGVTGRDTIIPPPINNYILNCICERIHAILGCYSDIKKKQPNILY